MMYRDTAPFQTLAAKVAAAVPAVDATVAHDRWKPGIGPLDEERQLTELLDFLEDDPWMQRVSQEIQYPDSGQRCDLVVDTDVGLIPIEAKLLRFRRDNGDLEPAAYGTVFSPLEGSQSLVADAQKLATSSFESPAGLLGIYYESAEDPFDRVDPTSLARKVADDVEFWFDIDVEMRATARFSGLRHPIHQQGAVISWLIDW